MHVHIFAYTVCAVFASTRVHACVRIRVVLALLRTCRLCTRVIRVMQTHAGLCLGCGMVSVHTCLGTCLCRHGCGPGTRLCAVV